MDYGGPTIYDNPKIALIFLSLLMLMFLVIPLGLLLTTGNLIYLFPIVAVIIAFSAIFSLFKKHSPRTKK